MAGSRTATQRCPSRANGWPCVRGLCAVRNSSASARSDGSSTTTCSSPGTSGGACRVHIQSHSPPRVPTSRRTRDDVDEPARHAEVAVRAAGHPRPHHRVVEEGREAGCRAERRAPRDPVVGAPVEGDGRAGTGAHGIRRGDEAGPDVEDGDGVAAGRLDEVLGGGQRCAPAVTR